ncbi:FecCD family ABC transporter permease [Aceticella autotrophica]|nr:iron ABC transporter permease [Aceticella autotrophica]
MMQMAKRRYMVFGFLILLLPLVVIFGIMVGSVKISPGEVITQLITWGNTKTVMSKIIWNLRIPRTFGAVLGGAALTVSGILLQALFRNPLAEPYILGISSGATLGMALSILAGIGFSQSPYGYMTLAILGAFFVTIMILSVARFAKSSVVLLLVGLMFAYIFSSIVNVLITFAPDEKVKNFTLWTLGSFSGLTWTQLKVLFFPTTIGLVLAFLCSKQLNASLLGEEYAKNLGINPKRFRFYTVAVASILTASITAFAGPISFVGLAVPHITRLMLGSSDHRYLLPAGMLLGASFTVLADTGARTLAAPVELPISVLTSIVGAPIVIILLLKKGIK